VDDILIAVAAQHAELGELIDGCTDKDWERPTRCLGWDVASVLLHLAQTDELAIASVRGELEPLPFGLIGKREEQTQSVDDAAAAQVEADRAVGGTAIRQRWYDASGGMRAVLADADPHKRVTWVTNQLSVQTLAATRLSECWIHTGDIAYALGKELVPTDRLRHIARLAWRTLPYAFEYEGTTMSGPVALDLTGPSGEPWRFDPGPAAVTTIRGSAVEFCELAARRVDPDETKLVGDGPDVEAVLRLVRTYAL
jgi:uncharacterized protein (TIGR03084 family)